MLTGKQWIGIIVACLFFYGAGSATSQAVQPQTKAGPTPTPQTVTKTVTKTVPDTRTQAKLAALTDVDNQILANASQMVGLMTDSLTTCANVVENPYLAASSLGGIQANEAKAQTINSSLSGLIQQRNAVLGK
jgi:hypothetical protein